MAEVFRRCGCRDEAGKVYGLTPERRCPRMTNPRHGSWGFRISAGTVADPRPEDPGHRKRRYVSASGYRTARDAREARDAALRKLKGQGDLFFSQITVADWLREWIETRDLRPSTERSYRTHIEHDIIPALGDKRLVKLTRNDVALFIDSLRSSHGARARSIRDLGAIRYAGRPRGAIAIRRIHATLSSALSSAVKRGLIDSNPAALADLPEAPKHEVRVWEQADVLRFLEAAEGHRLAPLFELALVTGLRRGELCALRWEDVDLMTGQLVVRRNLVKVGAEIREGRPKTKAGDGRVVQLSAATVDLLARVKDRTERERQALGEAWVDSGRVFTYEDGRQLRPDYPSGAFDKLVKRLGLPRIRFHDLRHQYASIQLDLGVELAVTSKLMGHANTAITADLYSHLLQRRARQQAEATAAWLRPEGGSRTGSTCPTEVRSAETTRGNR